MTYACDIMTSNVITVKKDTPLTELAKILYEHHFNGVPVVDDDGALIGIICESDLIRRDRKLHIPTVIAIFDWVLYLEGPKKTLEKEIRRISATKVEDLYTREVLTVSEKTPVEEIATIMSKKRVYTIPVMDGARLVGVIGKADLIRALMA
jgi:CBS domain-containing protein